MLDCIHVEVKEKDKEEKMIIGEKEGIDDLKLEKGANDVVAERHFLVERRRICLNIKNRCDGSVGPH